MCWFLKKTQLEIGQKFTIPINDPWVEPIKVEIVDLLPGWVRLRHVGGYGCWSVEEPVFRRVYKRSG